MLYATVRQRKVFVKKPTMVVRNGVNVDTLILEMDDEWASMDSILCVFTLRYSTAETPSTYQEVSKEMLHTFGEPLVVPWECLMETGKLSISCVGYVGTKQIMRTMKADSFWNVELEGIDKGDIPLEPTPTLYEQILAVVGTASSAAALCQKVSSDLEEAAARGDFDGEDGVTPTIEIGTVQTGQEGGEARVTKTGTAENVVLNFVLPRGMTGAPGKSPVVDIETYYVGGDNGVQYPQHIMTVTNPDGTKERANWGSGQNGRNGEAGGYFLPSVSEDGVLSWEYKQPDKHGMLYVPDDANIRGKDGYTPQKGVDYWTPEEEAEITAAKNAANTAAGNAQTVADEVRQAKENGEFKGDPFTYEDFTQEQLESLHGKAGTVSIISAVGLGPGEQPWVEEWHTSTENNRVYRLGIPKGATGDRGERGGVFHFFSGRYIENSGYIEKPDGGRVDYRFVIRLSELLRYTTYETVIAGDYVFWKENVGLFPVVHVDEDNVYLGEYVVIKGSDANVTEANIRDALGYEPANPDDVNELVSQKVDKQQGTENAGKVLGIGDDGMVVPVDAPNAENAVVTVEELPEATEESPDLVYLLNDEHGSEGEGGITEETDPTVPAWAKQPSKPDYTASEVGAIPAPITAEVGQVMRVAAVDANGKPTAWEKVNLAGRGLKVANGELVVADRKYELIETIIGDGVTATISRSEEPDGTPYAFDEVFFRLKKPKDVTTGYISIVPKVQNAAVASLFAGANTSTDEKYAYMVLEKNKGFWRRGRSSDWQAYNVVSQDNRMVYEQFEFPSADDDVFYGFFIGHTISAGVVIEVWAVRHNG